MSSNHVCTRAGAELRSLHPVPGSGSAAAGSRLLLLYLASRRIPLALGAIVGCSVILRAALEWHWIPSTGPLTQQLPVLLEAGTASIIAVSTYGPFGEPERATGRWLPYLRLGTTGTLSGIAVGLLSAGAAAADLPGGTLDMVRNVAGMAGIGLISAALIGGALSWIGPTAYLALRECAILNDWRTPVIWPTSPSHDLGATLGATLAFIAGAALMTALGVRQLGVE